MEAARVRFGSIVEWVLAAASLAIVLAIGSLVGRDLSAVKAVTPVSAREAPEPPPAAAVPSRAVSVPVLLLSDGLEIRVGEPESRVETRLAKTDEVGAPSIERGLNGERQTRFYARAGSRFVLVFEPLEQGSPRRVAAIYVQ